MKSIYKYQPDELSSTIYIEHHVIAFLKIDRQGGIPTVWAIVDTELPRNYICVYPVGTGWGFSSNEKSITKENYVGTLQDGTYVWHYFAAPPLE